MAKKIMTCYFFQCESIVEDLEEEFTTVFAAEDPQDAENEVWIKLTIESNKLAHIISFFLTQPSYFYKSWLRGHP